MELLLKHIQYTNWNIYGDLKVVALLLGMQLGYTKYCCYICEWNSWARESHYIKRKWPRQKNLVPGQKKVAYQPLVDPTKMFLPLLYLTVGLMKNFVKAINKEGEGFCYVRQMFPKIIDAKIREDIFVGPQISYIINKKRFKDRLVRSEKIAWKALKDVAENFLDNYRAPTYIQLVDKHLISAHETMKNNM